MDYHGTGILRRLSVNKLSVNKHVLRVFDGYSNSDKPSGPLSLGAAGFLAGPNEVTLEVIGKSAASAGYYVGLDGFMLKP